MARYIIPGSGNKTREPCFPWCKRDVKAIIMIIAVQMPRQQQIPRNQVKNMNVYKTTEIRALVFTNNVSDKVALDLYDFR